MDFAHSSAARTANRFRELPLFEPAAERVVSYRRADIVADHQARSWRRRAARELGETLVAVRLRPHRWRDRRRRRTPRKMPGSQAHYSRLAIETALTLRTVFKVALRQSAGHLGPSMRPRSPR